MFVTELAKLSNDFFSRELVIRMDVLVLASVNSQSDWHEFFGVDCGGELPFGFGVMRQVGQSFELSNQRHAIFALSLLTKLGNVFRDKREVFAV